MAVLSDNIGYLAKNIAKLQEAPGYPDQGVFVAEECSELIKELMKRQRKKGSDIRIKEEAIDVIASCVVLLKTMEVSNYEIECGVEYKYERALERYKKDGEF